MATVFLVKFRKCFRVEKYRGRSLESNSVFPNVLPSFGGIPLKFIPKQSSHAVIIS